MLGGGLACFWWGVLLMMREWDVAGRCCAGRGWWCAMAWIFLGLWVSNIRSQFLQIQSDCGKTNPCYLGSMLV